MNEQQVLQALRRVELSIDSEKNWYKRKFRVHAELLQELQRRVDALEKALDTPAPKTKKKKAREAIGLKSLRAGLNE